MSPIMWRSSVLLPHPLPPMMTNTSPRRTVNFRSCITTKLPKAIVRSRTVTHAGRSAAKVVPAAVVDSLVNSDSNSHSNSLLNSQSYDVENQRERSARDHDKDDPGHHRRGRRVPNRRRVVAALEAAQAS